MVTAKPAIKNIGTASSKNPEDFFQVFFKTLLARGRRIGGRSIISGIDLPGMSILSKRPEVPRIKVMIVP